MMTGLNEDQMIVAMQIPVPGSIMLLLTRREARMAVINFQGFYAMVVFSW